MNGNTKYWVWLSLALGAGAKVDEILSAYPDPIKLFEEETAVPDVSCYTGNRFDEIRSSCPFPTQYQTFGEYRVLYKVSRSSEHQQYVYAVGYFTIPES